MNPSPTAAQLLRSAMIELLRSALASDPTAAGAARELVRAAEGERVESELLDVLRSALGRV